MTITKIAQVLSVTWQTLDDFVSIKSGGISADLARRRDESSGGGA